MKRNEPYANVFPGNLYMYKGDSFRSSATLLVLSNVISPNAHRRKVCFLGERGNVFAVDVWTDSFLVYDNIINAQNAK